MTSYFLVIAKYHKSSHKFRTFEVINPAFASNYPPSNTHTNLKSLPFVIIAKSASTNII